MKESTYKNFAVLVLMIGLMFTNVDRQFLQLAMQSIKADLALSDTQLGFLTGFAFAVFFSVMGFPLARWADRGDRVRVIWVTTALSGIAIALCGAVRSFTQFLLVRICVAVGETGFMPAGNSLIADYFTRAERPRAMSLYLLGGSASVFLGFFLGGWLIDYEGWRATFVIMGVPGLLTAAFIGLGLREPRRQRPQAPARAGRSSSYAMGSSVTAQPTLSKALKIILSTATYRQLLYYYTVSSFFDYGRGQWQPAFFMRSFGMSAGSVGTWLGIAMGVSGLCGLYLGGWLTSRYLPNNERWQLRLLGISVVVAGMFSTLVYVAPTREMAFVFLALSSIVGPTMTAPFIAIMQAIVPERLRGQATALTFLISNLIGMGLGPLAAGAMSDALHSLLGQESLRYTLLAMGPGCLWGAWHAWRAGDTVVEDLANIETHSEHGNGDYADDAVGTV